MAFEAGEMAHMIDTCSLCDETRPVFNATAPLSERTSEGGKLLELTPWQVHAEPDLAGKCALGLQLGICGRCKQGRQARVRGDKVGAALFSGHKTNAPEDLGHVDDETRHNSMHFLPTPPHLLDLTVVERALIARVSCVMRVHLLRCDNSSKVAELSEHATPYSIAIYQCRHGMLSGKGHCVSVPNEMSIATQLPLLASHVRIVVLRRRDAKQQLRNYTVERWRVQHALEGLCYGARGLTEQEYQTLQADDADGAELYVWAVTSAAHRARLERSGDARRHWRYFTRESAPNPYYAGVEIVAARFDALPGKRAELPGLAVVETDNMEDESDLGPAAQVHRDVTEGVDPERLEQDESTTESGFACPHEPREMDDAVMAKLTSLLGDDAAAQVRARRVAVVDWPRLDQEPLPELRTEGFFTMAFPDVFVNGSCDITVPRLEKPALQEWTEHIYFAGDGRVPAHPTLKFLLLNLQLRSKALTQGSFVVNQQLSDAHLGISDLQTKLAAGDDSVARKVLQVGGMELKNTGPWWKERKRELDGTHQFRRAEYGDLPAYFDTLSMAENWWPQLTRLLYQYVLRTRGREEAERLKHDKVYRRQVLLQSGHIVVNYFDARTVNYYNTVLKARATQLIPCPCTTSQHAQGCNNVYVRCTRSYTASQELYQYDDVWLRYEFAKSRGAIHAHALVSSMRHAYMSMEALRAGKEEVQRDLDSAELVATRAQAVAHARGAALTKAKRAVHHASAAICSARAAVDAAKSAGDVVAQAAAIAAQSTADLDAQRAAGNAKKATDDAKRAHDVSKAAEDAHATILAGVSDRQALVLEAWLQQWERPGKETDRAAQRHPPTGDPVWSPGFVSLHPMAPPADEDEAEEEEEEEEALLTRTLHSAAAVPGAVALFCYKLAERLMHHACSGYCLKGRSRLLRKSAERAKGLVECCRECRFDFGRTEYWVKGKAPKPLPTKTSGKVLHPDAPSLTGSDEHPRFEGRRDHKRLVQHVRTKLLTWVGQQDSQVRRAGPQLSRTLPTCFQLHFAQFPLAEL